MEELGQIRLGTPFGDWLYTFCIRNAIKTSVEIGTWKGMGSTECILRAMQNSGRNDLNFISLEADEDMHRVATSKWSGTLPPWAHLIYGRVVDTHEMDTVDLGSFHPNEKMWFEQDRLAFSKCPNVLHMIPDQIDFLFLDGGEFSTYAEHTKLKTRSIFVGMDDTTSRKCKQIRQEVLFMPDRYEVLLDNPWHRNGVLVYKNLMV